MKIKIEINHWLTGSILFSFEKENNTVKETLIEAVGKGADLRGADLQGAYLRGAYLRGADLQGADLQGADLRGADLRGADLQGADLQGADLQGAYLRGAYLRGADLQGAYLQGAYLQGAGLQGADLRGALCGEIKIAKMAVFSGLYTYQVWAIIAEDGSKYIRMGCYSRTAEEWSNDFWNNPNEFPNDGSEKSELRLMAFSTAVMWFNLQDKLK